MRLYIFIKSLWCANNTSLQLSIKGPLQPECVRCTQLCRGPEVPANERCRCGKLEAGGPLERKGTQDWWSQSHCGQSGGGCGAREQLILAFPKVETLKALPC
jgi:hypothetical protein